MTTGNAPTIEEQIDALYKRGWNDSHQEKDYDPRKSIEWQSIRDSLKKLAAIKSQPVPEPVALKVGNLIALNQDEYPGLGDFFVQIWDGDEVAARIYGKDPQQIKQRLDHLNAAPAEKVEAELQRQNTWALGWLN